MTWTTTIGSLIMGARLQMHSCQVAKTGRTHADCGNHADICHVDMGAHTAPHEPCFDDDRKLDVDAKATTQRPHRFLFAGTGNGVQFPFWSVPIASLAWLGKARIAPCDCYEMKCLRKQQGVGRPPIENEKMKGEKQNYK